VGALVRRRNHTRGWRGQVDRGAVALKIHTSPGSKMASPLPSARDRTPA
jgi:hypothetical protein